MHISTVPLIMWDSAQVNNFFLSPASLADNFPYQFAVAACKDEYSRRLFYLPVFPRVVTKDLFISLTIEAM